MAVTVNCMCGKRLTAASRFAGRRVRCPSCHGALTLPLPGTAEVPESEAYSVQSPGIACPQCRSAMAPAEKLCVECGYHRELGHRLETDVSGPLIHGRPQDYRVEEQEDRLTFTKGPPLKGGLAWAIAILAIGLAVIGIVWTVHPITAGALLTASLPVYLLALHREQISVDRHWLRVRHDPFPWLGKTIPVSEIEQLYCRKRYHSKGRNRDGFYTYEVCVPTKNGRRIRVIVHLPVESHGFYFEERIEHFLGIADREVEEGTWERYGWIIRFVAILVLTIVVLILTNAIR